MAVLLALALIWTTAAPSYNRAVTSVARQILPRVVRAEVEVQEPSHIEMAAPDLTTRYLKIQGFTFQAGMVLVLALVLATPGMALRRRLAWAAATLPFFLVLHTGLLALVGWSFLWSVQNPRLGLKDFEPAFAGLNLLVPAVVGAIWCWVRWLPALAYSQPIAASTSAGTHPHSATRRGHRFTHQTAPPPNGA